MHATITQGSNGKYWATIRDKNGKALFSSSAPGYEDKNQLINAINFAFGYKYGFGRQVKIDG